MTTNKYISQESLRIVIKSEGATSTDAYERHCDIISKVIDLIRKEGADVDEWFEDDYGTQIFRIEDDGGSTEVSGWLGDNPDEPNPNAK